MYCYRKIIPVLLQATICILLLATPKAQAQSATPVRLLNIDVRLAATGSLTVTQEITFFAPSYLQWSVFGTVNDLAVTADGLALASNEVKVATQDQENRVSSSAKSGLTWTLRYQTTSQLIRSDERDQIYLPILKEAGTSVSNLRITFQLPEGVSGDGLAGNLYAIGGVNEPDTTTDGQRNVTATLQEAGPKAIVTLSAHWPTTLLRLSPIQELRLALANLEVLPWLTLGLFLPLISFLILIRLLVKQRRQDTLIAPAQIAPPEPLSPLIVGALVDKKIYPREIVAMLIDLCRRGYLVIVKKSGQYSLSQRKPLDTGLEPWERDILEALFPIANAKVTPEQVSQVNRQSLFNPKIRQAFTDMYDIITAKGFFTENPHQTRVRYKLSALTFYFLSVIGAIWIAISGATPFLLLPVAGTMIACRLIILYSPSLVHYTPTGKKARATWVSFGQYLAQPEPLPLEDSRNHAFEKYLGYAIALGQTKGWARRFDLSNIVIVKPDWFISYEETTTAQFASEIEEFNSAISKLLTEMRGPVVS